MPLMPRWVQTLAVCVIAATTLRGQGTFYSRTDLVAAYASVRDADGRLRTDLTKDDFEITEDGHRREISAFASDDTGPISVAVLLETQSLYERAGPLVVDLKILMAGLGKDDLAGVSNLLGASPPVSKNREALWNGLLIAPRMILNPMSLWDGLDRSVSSLGRETTRRVVMVLSSELEDGRQPPRSVLSPEDVARRVQRENIVVYSLSLAGTSADRRLKSLASSSGGAVISVRRDEWLGKVFTDLVDEMHHLYVLGFAPAKSDGKEHRIQVRSHVPGTAVRARQTYVAPRSK